MIIVRSDIKKYFSIFTVALILTGCGSKSRDCNSPEVSASVLSFAAKEIIDDGANEEKEPELIKKLSLANIKPIPQAAGDRELKCEGVIVVSYPQDFGAKIFNVFTTPASTDALRDHLNLKYGNFNGPAIYSKITKIIIAGIHETEIKTLSPQQVDEIVNKTIKRNIDDALNETNKFNVRYQIVSDQNDKNIYAVKSQIDDMETYEKNVSLLTLLGNFK